MIILENGCDGYPFIIIISLNNTRYIQFMRINSKALSKIEIIERIAVSS